MELFEKYRILEDAFRMTDAQVRTAHGKPFFDTRFGIWGATPLLDAYELFLRIRLDEAEGFVDLGSGDGRVAMLASLFTTSRGIEGDRTLVLEAEQTRMRLLRALPELARCSLVVGDYTAEDLTRYSVLFINPDHGWDIAFERKLRGCRATLLCYNRIYLPHHLKRGRTYWMQQVPVVSYLLDGTISSTAPDARR